MRKLIVFHIYGLGHFESLEDIEIDYLVVLYADNSVAYALSEQVNGARAHWLAIILSLAVGEPPR